MGVPRSWARMTVSDTVAVVTRWFGGVLLGAGGLVRAYGDAVRTALDEAGTTDRRLMSVDVLALPTTPVVAPAIQPLLDDEELYDRTDGLLLRNPQIANQFDLTAISLPMPGMSLPGGLMLLARNGRDRRLLSIAASVEEALRRAS